MYAKQALAIVQPCVVADVTASCAVGIHTPHPT